MRKSASTCAQAGRPKPAPVGCDTQLALRPSRLAQAGLEPRPTFSSGHRAMCASGEGQT